MAEQKKPRPQINIKVSEFCLTRHCFGLITDFQTYLQIWTIHFVKSEKEPELLDQDPRTL